ncbi:MAG TPA: adenylate/guanylate cyclase domain-containing protein [Usitatibacter sp.]|nr:adenylate/guanylate cyclase domain-containing protein [Usitatibacter sp.]HST00946.1 adenylate/guanylate cyclase domain-containing protein [Usitatibacter sp.]
MGDQTAGCVLFADVSGSTKLYEIVGDTQAHAAVDLCVKLFSALTEQHGGRVVKTIGDEVMAVFADAPPAATAARDIQLGVQDMAPVDKVRLGVRVGFHYGVLVERDGDVFGDTVNLAARLAEMASRGQIITSLETAERLAPVQKMDARRLYSIPVKGREREVDICELMWSDSDDATQVVASRASTDAGDALRLVYRTRIVVVGPERRSVVLGRDATADLVVADRMASRAHCEIEQRQDKFVIADRSANGTFLSIDGDREIVLRREEALLRGHGFITLGQSRSTATEFVEFFCE